MCPFPPQSVLARIWRRSYGLYDWLYDYPNIVDYQGAHNDKGYIYDEPRNNHTCTNDGAT
jgi:hypothetical protein